MEAALRGSAELDVQRINDLAGIDSAYDAVIIESERSSQEVALIAQANPGVPIIQLDWQRSTFIMQLCQKDNPLDAQRLAHILASLTTIAKIPSGEPEKYAA